MTTTAKEAIHQLLTGDDEGRLCRDIPESACKDQPGNFLIHIASLAATKTGDGLADPKLVLSWLLGALGAPAFFIGLLVPIREAGVLVPQLFISAAIRALPVRKWIWVFGSAVQGLSVIGMGMTAFFMEGRMAGWTLVGLLSLFALARSLCSVSYKDVLGKTLSKSTRGTASGTAGTVAAAFVLLFGTLLSSGILDKSVPVIASALICAGGLWGISAVLFATLKEEPGATEGGKNALPLVIEQFGLLKRDRQLRRFILTRALLLSTALSPPFLLALSGQQSGRKLGELGLFVLASALASLVSTYVWGRMSDRSSRKVLQLTGLLASLPLGIAGILGIWAPQMIGLPLLMPFVLFVLMIAHQGVRLGRSTHLVDMATPDHRPAYTALSNSMIGLLLIMGGGFGGLAYIWSESAVLVLFAIMGLLAAWAASGLDEVQQD
ncbi:MFS transporter [Iodidimonas gelatinilytica]|uniref:MFS transporter n=1 Tax=Iodidimonas gelatinilytica TaxID=1236966 RepID=A0A5A7MZX8_9PROT|nr:MFS transporter [Iodidimonas gelatinilytica]GER01327.1 MFS transporter [Iodidimonas gelatinilytica]